LGNPAGESCVVAVGESLGGCRIVGLIGRGGRGAVYEALQVALDRKVAVKVLEVPEDQEEKEAQSRLFQEARLTAKLNHPNIVQIYNVGEDRGIPFIVMEYVEGVTLRDLLRGQRVLPLKRLLRLGLQVSRGLVAAHDRKILHRDLKPENILLTGHGEVKIADFGTAGEFFHRVDPDQGIEGTPAFMAPEIIQRKPGDGKADVYSLGLVLYNAITGVHPFPNADRDELLRAHLEKVPAKVRDHRPETAPGLAALVERMCAKKPEARPSSRDVLEAFEHHPEWGNEQAVRKESPPAAAAHHPAPAPAATAHPPTPTPVGAAHPPMPAPPAAVAHPPAATPPHLNDPPRPAEKAKRSILDAPIIEERRAARRSPIPEGKPARSLPEPKSPSPAPPRRIEGHPAPTYSFRLAEQCVEARFQLLKKDWKKAEEKFREALAIEPWNEVALLGLAQVLTHESRHDEAVQLIEKAIQGGKLNPREVLEYHHFQPLKDSKAFRRLMVQYSL
jgi:serine/threonine protein kinase